jgi:hypothetical protein
MFKIIFILVFAAIVISLFALWGSVTSPVQKCMRSQTGTEKAALVRNAIFTAREYCQDYRSE